MKVQRVEWHSYQLVYEYDLPDDEIKNKYNTLEVFKESITSDDEDFDDAYDFVIDNYDPEEYSGGRNFGHLAFRVDDIYASCQRLMDGGVTINRPPRDGRMAFVRSPDGISIELLQEGDSLAEMEPWKSMENSGSW